MEKFTVHKGNAVGIDRSNIDTDQIIPKQFLKRVERTGYGQFLFYDWRYETDGSAISEFPLNSPVHEGASVLIAGSNFGCGSSREHAAWSLLDHGIRVVIAPSFGDIFYGNSLKNGLLPIRLTRDAVSGLIDRAITGDLILTIDLIDQAVTGNGENIYSFDIDEFNKKCLIGGLDEIALTLMNEPMITQFERAKEVR